MYIPNAYREKELEKLVTFMQANSFATLVSVLDGAPIASHIPVTITVRAGRVHLTGHLARANPQWQSFGQGESLMIFTGPHAYISPSLYEKRESVPTWNYIAVHAYGSPRAVTAAEERERLEKMVEAMIEQYDPAYQQQWQGLPEKFRSGMLQGIVGFEMMVSRLEGKYKLSQNRSRTDQQNVASALLQRSDPLISEIGRAMKENLEGDEG